MADDKKVVGRPMGPGYDPRRNLKGRPRKGQTIADAWRELLSEETTAFRGSGKDRVEVRMIRLRAFVEKVFSMAMNGDMSAAKLIANYVDGLPPFTGRVGGLPDEVGEMDPDEEAAVADHIKDLVLGKRSNGNGNGNSQG